MLSATLVTTPGELQQIYRLNQENLRQNLSAQEKEKEGFVTWLYSMGLLAQMHTLAPSVIVKDGERVIGYALVTLKEAAVFHKDLQEMLNNFRLLSYDGKPLFDYNFYCIGQICIHKDYRGQGVFGQLYNYHKKVYGKRFELLITEISSSNLRSKKAHEKTGFHTIDIHRDELDEWEVVAWNWQ